MRDNGTQHRDLDARRMRRQMRRDDGGSGRYAAVRIMVLGDTDPVETEPFDQSQPLDHAAIGIGAGALVILGRRERPACRQQPRRPVMSGFEIRDLHGSHLAALSPSYSTTPQKEMPRRAR